MLSELNYNFEHGSDTLPSELWEQWIWETDPQEQFEPLNKCQLLGLLLARFRGRYRGELCNVQGLFPTMVHTATNIQDMTLRQVRDQLDDLQLHWNKYVMELTKCHTILDGLMTRFGVLCDSSNHDDKESVDVNGHVSINTIRHFVSIFVILYRHIWLWNTADASANTTHNIQLEPYHVEASLETFALHNMIVQLPPAARLLYQQEFKGMYHCISQVVFFHFPDYEAPLQLPIEQLRKGLSYHALAPLSQIHPIPIIMDDENVPNTMCWILLSGGHIFLWRNRHSIETNENIFIGIEQH